MDLYAAFLVNFYMIKNMAYMGVVSLFLFGMVYGRAFDANGLPPPRGGG